MAGDSVDVASAGTHPVGLNPGAVEAMNEIGVDIAGQRSKSVKEFLAQRFDYVITVCDRARESCPVFPAGSAVLHWSFDDPAKAEGTAEERKIVFRRVRNEIAEYIDQFVRLMG